MAIVRSVVSILSDLPVGSGASYVNTGIANDYAIGGIPFMGDASNDQPLTRQTADYTKTQIDQDNEPGEQTLIAWWLRAQSSFHGGTGIVFEEPDGSTEDLIQYRFADSAGVDVWTPGSVTLLPSAPLDVAAGSAAAQLMGAIDGNDVDCYFLADNITLKRCTGTGSGAAVTWGGSNTIQSMCQDGTNYYVADSVGIWQGTLVGGNGTQLWDTGASLVTVAWCKQRLMAAIGPSIYELAGGSPPALPAPNYTHPNPHWVWTAFAESPEAIYAAGYAGSQSAIYMFALDTSGDVPTLTGGIVVANLPTGEQVTSIYGYLGTYLAIGSSKGIRIAEVQSDGTLQYGPLTVVLPAGAGPVQDLVGVDRFVYGTYANGIGGQSGLFRLDLGTTTGTRLYAWANDLQAHVAGNVTSVDLLGASGRLVFCVAAHGAYLQSTTLEPTGYLKTGNIRFHMLEPKLYKYVRVYSQPLTKGGVSITTEDHASVATGLVTFTAGLADDPLDEIGFPTGYGPQQYVSLTIGFNRDATDVTSGPTVNGYQIKALPAQKRQRNFVVPMLCFDHQTDRIGATVGYEGYAIARLLELEALEEAGDVVRFDDLTTANQPARLVIIDSLVFKQVVAPTGGMHGSGWGGVLTATLRAVD